MVKLKPLMEKSKKTFNHLKIHTQYSICEGAIKIEDLEKFCNNNKIKSIGISDTSNLCGALEFSEKLSKVGTHPIIGTQINLRAHNIIGKITDPNQLQKNTNAIVSLPSTLDKALNISKQNNPDILIAKLDLEKSDKDLAISESDLKPTASL